MIDLVVNAEVTRAHGEQPVLRRVETAEPAEYPRRWAAHCEASLI